MGYQVKVDTTPRPLADNAKAEITAALQVSIKQFEHQIQIAADVASALAPIAHHKKLDAHVTKFLEIPCNHLHTYFNQRYSTREFGISWSRLSHERGVDSDLYNVRYETYLNNMGDRGDVNTVQQLIDLLREAPTPNAYLRQAKRQLECLDFLLEAEATARQIIQSFEDLRKNTSEAVFGQEKYGYRTYYHEAIHKHLTVLTAV